MADESQAAEASTQAIDSQPIYEVGFHVVPTVGDEGVSKAVEAVRKALGDAEIISEGFPQKISLAYRVERSTQGKREKYTESYFGHIKFATKREALPALQEALRAMQPILRFIVVETVREDIAALKPRAVFASDRLEGKTLEKPAAAPEKVAEVSEAELDKSLEALTG
jgi:ribosomal protein S6